MIYCFVTDLKEPWKVIAEPGRYLIAPLKNERVGDVSNVVFTNGAIADDTSVRTPRIILNSRALS